MGRYVIKRILLMFLTLFIIMTMCFVLIKLLPLPAIKEMGRDINLLLAKREKLGYGKPILVQYFLYLKSILTTWDWGVGEQMYEGMSVWGVLLQKLPYTVLVNLYSIIIAIPLGLIFGIYAALKKNKWQDHVISTAVIVFISVPSYVYAFLVQYLFCYKLGWFPLFVSDVQKAQGSENLLMLIMPYLLMLVFAFVVYLLRSSIRGKIKAPSKYWPAILGGFMVVAGILGFGVGHHLFRRLIGSSVEFAPLFSADMFVSMVPAVLSLGFGVVAGLTRYTRAELSEVLTGDYMLLARTKGLTKGQAISRHAMRNAMVVILPMIIGEFIGILGGSLIIEKIFSVPGIGALFISSIEVRDYNFFMALIVFYTFIGLASGIIVDISYGFIDPRIRMGSKK